MNPHDPMIEPNDLRLTAYVLGELAPNETAQIEDALKSSPKLRAAVADIRRATESIAGVFQAEPSLQLAPEQRTKLLAEAEAVANTDVHSSADNVTPSVSREHYRPSSGATAHWIKIAVAAGLAGLLLSVGAFYSSEASRPSVAASDEPMTTASDETEKSAAESKDQLNFKYETFKYDAEVESLSEPRATKELKATKQNDRSAGFANKALPFGNQDGESEKLSAPKEQAFFVAPKTSAPQNRAMPALEADSAGDTLDDMLDDMQNNPSKMAKNAPIAKLPADRRSQASGQAFSRAAAPSLSDAKPAAQFGSRSRSSELSKAKSSSAPTPSVTPRREELKLLERNLASNPATLSKAQQSLDQSSLRSLNLKVVAQNTHNLFSQSIGGTGFGGGADEGQSLGAAKPMVQSESLERLSNASLPTTFKLQISDQDAKRMVKLLAAKADPSQQRRLSFEELIGLQKLPQDVNGSADYYFESPKDLDGDGDRDLELKTDSAADRKTPSKKSSTLQTAAVLLASKLREHIRRPMARMLSVETLSVKTLDNLGGSIEKGVASASESPLEAQPATAGESVAGGRPGGPILNGKLVELGDEFGSNEFNFDYSQVIQQLKSNLEFRNQSVVAPKSSPARIPAAP